MSGRLYLHLLDKLAVYSESYSCSVLKRLYMDIRCVHSERGFNYCIYQLNDRCVINTLA